MRVSQNIPAAFWFHFSSNLIFYSSLHILWLVWHVVMILLLSFDFYRYEHVQGTQKNSVTVSFLSISEKGDHTTQKSNYISGKWKELKYRKWSIKWCWNILTKSNLLGEIFYPIAVKRFLETLWKINVNNIPVKAGIISLQTH